MADPRLLWGRRPPHYPRAFAQDVDRMQTLEHQVPVRPARFPVGLEKPLFPPPGKVRGTAISVASYLGRVEEVSETGEVTVTLWERPNGREGLTTLSVTDHLEGKAPNAGDLLWIWTWIDVIEKDRREPGIHVEVESHELDEEARARLRALSARLEEDEE